MRRKLKGTVKVESDEDALTWTCPSCGAENAAYEVLCNECKVERPDTRAALKGSKTEDSESEESEAPLLEPSRVEDEIEEAKEEDHDQEPEIVFQPTTPSFTPSFTPQPVIPSPEPQFASSFVPQATGHSRYYLVFVATAASSLVKSKVPIDFELFPIISIGRSPENIVVIPDLEVSRKHAELTTDGVKLMLRDLNSKNGTFLYNGKEFLRVSDSVEVKPNSIVKFGTGTIVRLTSE